MITHKARATGKKVEGVGAMRDKELKLVAVNASRTLVERGRSCAGRGKWRGCRCYLLTDTRSRRISLAGKKAERGRGAVRVCGQPADRYTKLVVAILKKKYKYHVILYCLCFLFFYVFSALVNKKRVNI